MSPSIEFLFFLHSPRHLLIILKSFEFALHDMAGKIFKWWCGGSLRLFLSRISSSGLGESGAFFNETPLNAGDFNVRKEPAREAPLVVRVLNLLRGLGQGILALADDMIFSRTIASWWDSAWYLEPFASTIFFHTHLSYFCTPLERYTHFVQDHL